MNRFIRAWRELTNSVARRSYTSGGFSNSWGGWNPVDNSQRDLSRTVHGATLAYLYAPPVKSAIDVIAQNAASVPLMIIDRDGNEVARSDGNVDESPVLKAFERSWVFHRQSLVSLWVRSHLLFGMTFLEKRGDLFSGADLKWLNTNSIMINAPRGVIDSIQYNGRDRFVTYTPEEIIYAKAFNPDDDVYGYSATMNIMAEVNAAIHFDKFKAAYYNNGGQPGFAFVPEVDASEDQLIALRDFWRNKLTGVENFFKLAISSIPGKLTQFDPIDISKPLQMSQDTKYRILQGFGVPPEMIGDTQNNPYQFSSEKKNAFMQTVVRPTLKTAVLDAMNYEGFAWLDPIGFEKGYRLQADFSEYEIASESTLKEQENVRQNFLTGGMSYSDYQRAVGEEPVEAFKNLYFIPGLNLPVPRDEVPNLWKYRLIVAPSELNSSEVTGKPLPQPVDPTEVIPTGNPDAPEGELLVDAPEPEGEQRTISLIDLKNVARKFDISLAQTLDYFEEFERAS